MAAEDLSPPLEADLSVRGFLGHESMRRGWGRGFQSGRLGHAHLVAGPEGIGKGFLVRRWAALLLCRDPQFGAAPDPQACGHCSSCQALKSGNHGGYLEISTEGSGPVEIARMREILHFLSLRADGRRVILIDSADQLREEATNALLKILEEPPAETHFLLVSHRPARLLKTIVSRCQRWLLGPLARDPFLEILDRHGVSGDLATFLFEGAGGRPGAALLLGEAIERCGGIGAFGQILGEVPDDPRDLVSLTLREGESFDRQTVQRTLKVIGDGLWAFRGETLESRERAATRTLMLSHVSRHLERFGSADLVIEAAAMVLRSENPRDVVSRIPRVMGTHWA